MFGRFPAFRPVIHSVSITPEITCARNSMVLGYRVGSFLSLGTLIGLEWSFLFEEDKKSNLGIL